MCETGSQVAPAGQLIHCLNTVLQDVPGWHVDGTSGGTTIVLDWHCLVVWLNVEPVGHPVHVMPFHNGYYNGHTHCCVIDDNICPPVQVGLFSMHWLLRISYT